ncbi:MAG: hypothetical protein JST58_19490 [Bacteroidetes bacterium]|nr:hypothetical protein [Bacteroidota bacterium]
MKRTALIAIFIFTALISDAQLCPGGGTNFSNAVLFDPTWISSCTGTSGGGTVFSNLSSCEPTTAMDPCAPTPSCGSASDMGSDIWFKFYATSSTATISITQNVSLVVGIQAFTGGLTCGTLIQSACSVSNGPSSGTSVILTNLITGGLYYFRVYGDAKQVSQRTGLYSFCGSSGMSNVVLPVKLLSFAGSFLDGKVVLDWKTSNQVDFSHFEIERSTDGGNFTTIVSEAAQNSLELENNYSYQDYQFPHVNSCFYRLKMVDLDGNFSYSPIVKVNLDATPKFTAWVSRGDGLHVEVDNDTELDIFNSVGMSISKFLAKKGSNLFYRNFTDGVYIIRRRDTGEALKLLVIK